MGTGVDGEVKGTIYNVFSPVEPTNQDRGDVHLQDWQARPRQGSHGRARHLHW